jgi:hypothetical protein
MSHVSLPPTAESASPSKRWQFRLWHLFALMTYVAVMLSVVTWQGPQSLMVTIGLGLALLSHLGAFERLQQGRAQLILVGVAWVTYLVSLCTPCGVGIFTLFGWQAAWTYLWEPISAIFTQQATLQGFTWPWLWSVNLANALQLTLPLLIWRLSRGRGKVLSVLICLAMIGPWTTLIMAPGLYIAYYIWCFSFMLLVMAVPVSRATLIGMVGLAILHAVIFKIFDGSA